ncbi:MAG TPA: hypothetical protein VHE30_29335 [Polyangiaceae bacterium]|nr:hypothetical protein [Polyangiaceae bacterium]
MSRIPDDVQEFLRARIKSYEELEALVLLSHAPERRWTAAALSSALDIRLEDAREALVALRQRGLVEARGDSYSYLASPLDETVERLAVAYADNRLGIMNQMSANAIERVRSATARALADAFVLRRGKKDG